MFFLTIAPSPLFLLPIPRIELSGSVLALSVELLGLTVHGPKIVQMMWAPLITLIHSVLLLVEALFAYAYGRLFMGMGARTV